MIWAVGTLSNLVSGNTVGVALAYAAGQSAPMVSLPLSLSLSCVCARARVCVSRCCDSFSLFLSDCASVLVRPKVATGWGVLYYREFDGAPKSAWCCLGAMVLLYAGAIAMIALSNSG